MVAAVVLSAVPVLVLLVLVLVLVLWEMGLWRRRLNDGWLAVAARQGRSAIIQHIVSHSVAETLHGAVEDNEARGRQHRGAVPHLGLIAADFYLGPWRQIR